MRKTFYSSNSIIRDICRIPAFDVILDANKIGILIQFHGNFEDSTDRSSLLDYICDQCEWKLIGQPSTGMVQRCKALIEHELNYLVRNGTLRCSYDEIWRFNYRAAEKLCSNGYDAFAVGTGRLSGLDDIETFEGADDFEDVA